MPKKDRTPDKTETEPKTQPEPASTPEAENAPQAEDEMPMNRAERRAKGKKSGQQGQAGGRRGFTPKTSQAQAPRMWTNRRGGG